MQIARSYRYSQNDWPEDFGKRGVGVEICEQCLQGFIGTRRRKVCHRCYDERELARREKERAKLDELALAKEMAEESERLFRSLVSLHKAEPAQIVWLEVAASLAPASHHDLGVVARSAWRKARLENPEASLAPEPAGGASSEVTSQHTELVRRWQENRTLAKRVVLGDATAYPEALQARGAFADLLNLGIAIDVTVESPKRLLIEVLCESDSLVPSVSRTLTSTGKLSEKNLPRARHQEIYQDHVCSVMLRVARECFAVLPIDMLLLNGKAEVGAKAGAARSSGTIYSVLIDRQQFERLNFAALDPSDAISDFPHRGDFKASRKAGAFSPVTPLTFADTQSTARDESTLSSLREQAAALRVCLNELQSSKDS